VNETPLGRRTLETLSPVDQAKLLDREELEAREVEARGGNQDRLWARRRLRRIDRLRKKLFG
jgi:hypothetical protein